VNNSHKLPNLLDDQPSYGAISRLLQELRSARQRVFVDWTPVDQSVSSHKPSLQALDAAFVLGLILEYVRGKNPNEFSAEHCPVPLCNHVTIQDMAQTLLNQTSNPILQKVLSHSFFSRHLSMPRDISLFLFNKPLPTVAADVNGQLPITLLGDFHQLCLANPLDVAEQARNRRREQGAHYTPPALVDYMVSRSLGQMLPRKAAMDGFSVLDPSCGCGAFLVGVLRYLTSQQDGKTPQEILQYIHGSDIDAQAIALAQLSLLLTWWSLPNSSFPGTSTNCTISQQLITQDFLDKPGCGDQMFDLIIGGPPFIRVEALHKTNPEQVARYRAHYETARAGQFDIYMPFIEQAVGLLKAGGCLAFSVSNSFLRTTSGASLRQFLASRCQVEEIIEFEDGNIYPDASVQIAILILRQRSPGGLTRYAYVRKNKALRPQLQQLLAPQHEHEHGDPKIVQINLTRHSTTWGMHSDEDARFIAQLEAAGTPLGKLPVSLTLGMCTGADDIFIHKPVDSFGGDMTQLLSRNGTQIELESSILKPILRGRYVTQTTIVQPPHVCIFPYDETGNIVSEEKLRLDCPRTYEYLRDRKKRLSQRRLCTGQPWYALRKVDIAQHLAKPKLIVPTICSFGSFFLDITGVLCHHSILTVTPKSNEIDIYYLLGLLNSGVLWRYISLRAASMGANRRVLRLKLAKTIPILLPESQEQRSLATAIAQLTLSLQKAKGSHDNPMQTGRFDELINELYGVKAV